MFKMEEVGAVSPSHDVEERIHHEPTTRGLDFTRKVKVSFRQVKSSRIQYGLD